MEYRSVDEVQSDVLRRLLLSGETASPRGVPTLESRAVSFTLADPRRRCVVEPRKKMELAAGSRRNMLALIRIDGCRTARVLCPRLEITCRQRRPDPRKLLRSKDFLDVARHQSLDTSPRTSESRPFHKAGGFVLHRSSRPPRPTLLRCCLRHESSIHDPPKPARCHRLHEKQ